MQDAADRVELQMLSQSLMMLAGSQMKSRWSVGIRHVPYFSSSTSSWILTSSVPMSRFRLDILTVSRDARQTPSAFIAAVIGSP